MIQKTLVVGPLQCNCVILACPRTQEAIIVDPGDEGPKILAEVSAMGLNVKYLVHTHAHFDHIGATRDVHAALKAPPCLHRDDEMIYNNLPMQGRLFGFEFQSAPPVERFLQDEEVLEFGDEKVQVLHTPGHSPGSLCLHVLGNKGLLFSGDTLFRQSIGRTDLWGGNHEKLLKSVRDRIFTLDSGTKVFPGHGPATLVGEEMRTNPFLA